MPPHQITGTCQRGSIHAGPSGLRKRKPCIQSRCLDARIILPSVPKARAAPHVGAQKFPGLRLSENPHPLAVSGLGQSSFFLGRCGHLEIMLLAQPASSPRSYSFDFTKQVGLLFNFTLEILKGKEERKRKV